MNPLHPRKSGLILQRMTPQQKLNLKKQYIVWTEQAIKQMQNNAVNNITKRIPIMLAVANDKTRTVTTLRLTITNTEQNEIVQRVHAEIATWNGIQIGACKTEKDQYSDYSNTARNWFNRNKAKIYGNHLFYSIIFVKIYQFLLSLSGITDTQKIVLFVDILDGILHSTVQFKRSKAHPVIPHQTFIQPNLFRSACSNLCQYYLVQWDLSVTRNKRQLLPNGQYAKNRERSRNINNAFVRKIEEIKQNVLYKQITKSLPLFHDQFDASALTENEGRLVSLEQTTNSLNHQNHTLTKHPLPPLQDPKTEVLHVPSFDAECATGFGNSCQTTDNHSNNHNHHNNNNNNNQMYLPRTEQMNNIAFNAPSLANPPLSNLNVTPTPNTVYPINVQYSDVLLQPTIPNPQQLISAPILPMYPAQSVLALLNGVDGSNYTANHGQNNMVSQLRYSPFNLQTTPEVPVHINVYQNMDGTLSISLDNIQRSQAIQLISNTLR